MARPPWGDANAPHPFALLRARRERPCSLRTAEQRDERAPFDAIAHSITSSARAINIGGMSMRSARAVLRLITSSNVVGSLSDPLPDGWIRTNVQQVE
jgi:hypothetical protein